MDKRPVVALVCDAIYPYSQGGREARYRELLPRLARQAEMHVYTMKWWAGPSTYQAEGVTFHAIASRVPLYADGNRRSLRQVVKFGLACVRMLKYDFDILEADHIPYLQIFVLRVVATMKRTPFIVTWHEVWSREYWKEYLGYAGLLAWSGERLAMRLPNHIIAASSQTADRLWRALGKRRLITTVPNGIDLDLIRSVTAYPAPSDLIVVGRLIEHKRIDVLLSILGDLHQEGIRVTCRVVGDGPAREALTKQAERLGIGPDVEFLDNIEEPKELYSLMKAAKIFVSLSAREGFGMATLEAIACGVAVLTTSAQDNLAQHLVVSYSRGVVCEPKSADVKVKLLELLSRDERCQNVSDATDLWIAEYDWNALADLVAGVYSI